MGVTANRLIGRYTGKEKGPLLIILGGMHGNEPAGIRALTLMFKMLEVEPITNPSFNYKGRIIGLIGNVKAYEKRTRFIESDLNRIWTLNNVNRIKKSKIAALGPEEQELKELIEFIESEIKSYKPSDFYLLDLHTTSSFGGIFTIVTDDPKCIEMGLELHAPVIKGMLDGLKGTTMHYFTTENMGVRTVAITFESGQHDELLSVNRAIAAITNCMRFIGSVEASHVENRHDSILIEYSRNLPKVSRLVSRQDVKPGDNFKMLPNYDNFQLVKKGEIVASTIQGEIKIQEDSLILMPLYQDQGEDGFFLVKEIKGY